MSKKDRFLKACRREPVDTTPVWLMRQAGRYMAAYRALRTKHSLLEMIKTPELATEVTLQPIRAFDLDAAIVFSDILPLLDGMGLALEFIAGQGPVLHRPIESPGRVADLPVPPAEESMSFTLETIRRVQAELDGQVPLVGFSGAPFTLACYALEGRGSKEFARGRTFMREHPTAWHALMEKLSTVVGSYLSAQVAAGADALQMFDSWAGLLDPAEYREFVLPYSRHVVETARGAGDVPFIHFGTGTSEWLGDFKEAGGDVIGIDWRIDLSTAWDIVGSAFAVQGNLDPATLLGTPDDIRAQAAAIMDSVHGRPGHIFNLGHGVVKETPEEHVALLVDFVHAYSCGKGAGE